MTTADKQVLWEVNDEAITYSGQKIIVSRVFPLSKRVWDETGRVWQFEEIHRPPAQDRQAVLIPRLGEDNFIRTAIVVAQDGTDDEGTGSVDVVTPDGRVLARLIFYYFQDGQFDIDIATNVEGGTDRSEVLYWEHQGAPTTRIALPRDLVAINIHTQE